MSENFSKKNEDIEASKAPLISHLIELRDRLKWAVLFFFLAFCFWKQFSTPGLNPQSSQIAGKVVNATGGSKGSIDTKVPPITFLAFCNYL